MRAHHDLDEPGIKILSVKCLKNVHIKCLKLNLRAKNKILSPSSGPSCYRLRDLVTSKFLLVKKTKISQLLTPALMTLYLFPKRNPS
jgi:hypothetical protein